MAIGRDRLPPAVFGDEASREAMVVDPGDEIYGFPLVGEATAGVKVGFHHRGPDVDPDDVDRVVSEAEKNEMRATLAQRIPGLAGDHVTAKA